MILHHRSQHVWQRELRYAKMCLDLLAFCGHVDDVAQQFKETTQQFYDILASQGEQPLNETAISQSDPSDTEAEGSGAFDHLFTIPQAELSAEHLYSTFQRTFDILSNPFTCSHIAQAQGTLSADEVGIGAHLDWATVAASPSNRLGSGPPQNPPSAPSSTSVSVMSGRFIGSSNPHGWSVVTQLPN